MICFIDIIVDKLSNILNLLSRDRYPSKLINKHPNAMKRGPKVTTFPKNVLFIELKFLNDATEEIVIQRL